VSETEVIFVRTVRFQGYRYLCICPTVDAKAKLQTSVPQNSIVSTLSQCHGTASLLWFHTTTAPRLCGLGHFCFTE